ncbi:hypothetical protein TWF788_009514 [Orbilia oligospora]|uniref:Uncharacterized protein n=1 Tax=Orbilia oligospora TaxID=2813651 RepID=A0A7C8PBJ3_ORBOL|nr:hypothetical protein TWF788_009514 [Orbilia oligospora]
MSFPHPLVAKPSTAAAGASAIKPTIRSLAPAAEHKRVERLKHDGGIYKRSSRCSGETPTCSRCQKLKHECTYNAIDQRDNRKDMKGQLQRQKVENTQYKEILNHIKTASLPDLRKTMTVLRNPTGTSIEELLMFIRNDGKSILSKQDIRPTPATTDLTLLGNSQVETTDQTVPEQISLGIIDDRPLSDLNLTAEPWTTITDDDELVSHLISSYIAWDAVAWNWFDVDIFLEGMVQKDFKYCTPLLVNCILALACHLSPRIPVRSDPHNPNSLGHRFIEEAIHLWHVECSQPKLTTIISGMLLCEVVSVNGKDHLGYMLFQSTVSLYHRLFEQRESSGKLRRDEKMERALGTTVWGLFRLSTFFTLLNKKKPPMDIPTIKLPENRYADENEDNGSQKKRDLPIFSLWRPYPYTQPAEPCRLEESVRMCSDVCVILHDLIVSQTTGTEADLRALTVKQKKDLYARAMEWKRDIPKGLNLGDTVAPFVITPHLGYFQLIIELSNAPLDPADTEPEELATFHKEVNGWYKQGKADLLRLLREYDKNYSFAFIPETMLLGLMYAAKIITEELTSIAESTMRRETSPDCDSPLDTPTGLTEDSGESLETLGAIFEKTIGWLCSVSEQYFTAKLYARALQLSGESLNVVLSDATKKKLDSLFSVGDGSKSRWIEQLYKADSLLTLSLGHRTDSVVDVIEKLDSLKV